MLGAIALITKYQYNVRRIVVFGDSKKVLEAVCHFSSTEPLICHIHRWLSTERSTGRLIETCWLPPHVSLARNERVDRLAQLSCHNSPGYQLLRSDDLFPIFRSTLQCCICFLATWVAEHLGFRPSHGHQRHGWQLAYPWSSWLGSGCSHLPPYWSHPIDGWPLHECFQSSGTLLYSTYALPV